MDYRGLSKTFYESPLLILENNIIIEVNSHFIEMCDYLEYEIVGRSFSELCDVLRITPLIDLYDVKKEEDYYLFSKALDFRNFNISIQKLSDKGVIALVFSENYRFDLEDKSGYLNQIIKDNLYGVGILSAKDLTILKANDKYLSIFRDEYSIKEKCIGKKIIDILSKDRWIDIRKLWEDMLKFDKSIHIDELELVNISGKVAYLEGQVMPIHINGKLKYFVVTTMDITEKVLARKQIEEQTKVIQQQNMELHAILDNISDGVFFAYKDEKFNLLNSAAEQFVYKPETINYLKDGFIETTFTDMKGNTIPFDEMPLQRALKGEKVKDFKSIIKYPGKEFAVECSAAPIYDKDGNLFMAVVCTHDITDLANREKMIEVKNKELEVIIENISEELYIFDKDRNFIKLNHSAKERIKKVEFGMSHNPNDAFGYYELSGEKIRLEDYPIIKVSDGLEIKNETIIGIDPDKRYILINGKPILDGNGDFSMGIVSVAEVTNDILYREAIERQFDMLSNLIHNIDLPLIRLSCPDLIVLDINQKTYKYFKDAKPELKTISDIVGKKYKDVSICSNWEDIFNCIQQAIQEKKASYIKYHRVSIPGEEMFVNILYQPLFGLNGEVEELVAIVVDVTSEVKSNKEMEKTLKLQEEFFVNISHELKTPLNVIYATIQLLNMYFKNGSLDERKDSIAKFIESITQNCYRLSKLINNIVDLSKIEAGFYELNLSNNNIVEVVEKIVMSVADYTTSKGLNIIFDTDVEEKIIACDPEKIERIILNLISNAIKFSDEGDEIYVNIKDKKEFIEISVKDNGIGIDESNLNMIFERFKQIDKSLSRNAEGTGIGLSLVKSIVELHGGRIYAESELGKGSKFIVSFPAAKVEKESILQKSLLRSSKEIIDIELSDISK